MKAHEQRLNLIMSRTQVNLLTTMMPMFEGLFSATVTDGKNGRVSLYYDASVSDHIHGFVDSLEAQHGPIQRVDA